MRFYTSTIFWSLLSTTLVSSLWAGQLQTSQLPSLDTQTQTIASQSQKPRDKSPHRGSGRVEPAKAVALARAAQTEQSGDKSPPRGSSRRAAKTDDSEPKPASGSPDRGSGRRRMMESSNTILLA